MKVIKVILLSLILSILSVQIWADDKDEIINQQKELEKIKSEIQSRQKKLDELKKNELKLQKELSETDQKIRTNKTVIDRLNKQLSDIKNTIDSTEADLRDRELFYNLATRRFLGNIRNFYKATINPVVTIAANVNDQMLLDRQIKYRASLAKFESGNMKEAYELLNLTISQKEKLHGEQKEISYLKKKKETSQSLAQTTLKKKEKDLSDIRKKELSESDRLMFLEEAAEEMEKILVKLQQEAEERLSLSQKNKNEPSFFTSLKGHLTPPYKGKIIKGFGSYKDKVTALESFSSGITIKGVPGSKVVAVASGTVVYVGELRGYGLFIIINHDDRYFTTYAGLGKSLVSNNEFVLAGNKLAVSDDKGIIKFELRQSSKELDPLEWIRIDSYE